jgi:hypothetical protein
LKNGFEVFVVEDACGGLSREGHELALRRMESAGHGSQVGCRYCLSFSGTGRGMKHMRAPRDCGSKWGGYGIGLVYARDMIHP